MNSEFHRPYKEKFGPYFMAQLYQKIHKFSIQNNFNQKSTAKKLELLLKPKNKNIINAMSNKVLVSLLLSFTWFRD